MDPVNGSPDVLEDGLVGHVELPAPHPLVLPVTRNRNSFLSNQTLIDNSKGETDQGVSTTFFVLKTGVLETSFLYVCLYDISIFKFTEIYLVCNLKSFGVKVPVT